MAPKQQLEKAAWQWAETTEPENITDDNVETVYRIKLKPCKKGVCRRNCKGNPHCLVGMGEREWMCEIADSSWHDIEDPNNERRKEGSFVGLKNLGATCYVSTFIQVWFHNPEFRTAIYKWRDMTEAGHSSTSSQEAKAAEPSSQHTPDTAQTQREVSSEVKVEGCSAEEKELMPTSACGHLQLIFALLHFSKRRYIDPTPFVSFLGLNTAQQQDAQEFSKLFISVLEDGLSAQPDRSVRNYVQEQFSGKYEYVTRCNTCSWASQRPSNFYELDLNIKGHKELRECLEEFLEEEKLEGDNQYMCAQCNTKQNATRRIELRTLPPVLNLQLLRFVFDRNSGHKKKLNTFIEFPEVLDMSSYVQQPDGQYVYNLVSVLIHRGPSAYSGHYVAHIKDRKSQTWYKLNDEEIEKMAGKNLQLGNEEEIDGKGSKKPRTTKGCHYSKNAYMLVYERQTLNQNETVVAEVEMPMLPENVQQYVHMDNQRFEEWIREMDGMRDQNVVKGKARQDEIQEIYNMLAVTEEGAASEWIAADWLTKWLSESNSQSVPPVDNSAHFCSHNRLDPDKIEKVKCISEKAAETIYSKYGGGPRLKRDLMCHECVRERCKVIRTRARVTEDNKIISEVLKAKNLSLEPEDSYWVGKNSLRSWKRLVMEQLEDSLQKNGSIDLDSGDLSYSSATSTKSTLDSSLDQSTKSGDPPDIVDVDADDDKGLDFNEDIVCDPHRNLSTDVTSRRLIPGDVWGRFKVYFPQAAEFRGDIVSCRQCQARDEEEEEGRNLQRGMASAQKVALGELYHDRHRPTWGKNVTQLDIVSQHFLEQWRGFIRDPLKQEPVCEVGNRSLLCPHSGFLYEPSTIGLTDSTSRLVYIWPGEWETLKKHIAADVEIQVSRVEEDGNSTFYVSPDLCKDCSLALLEEERRAQLNYTNATVFIRKLTEQTKSSVTQSETPSPETNGESLEKSDPEFIQQQNGKRKKVSHNPVPEKLTSKIDNSIRRSSRHRRMRGEKEVTVSSSTTLSDLKIQIMHLFSVAPFDQHLLLDGVELTGNKTSLAGLKITPGAVVYLKVDEPCDDPTFLDDLSKATSPEEGFKGTNLQGR